MLTPEQEAELAKAIEQNANRALVGRTPAPILPPSSKLKSDEDEVAQFLSNLTHDINNRNGFRNYR
jgi:hypothetical protein